MSISQEELRVEERYSSRNLNDVSCGFFQTQCATTLCCSFSCYRLNSTQGQAAQLTSSKPVTVIIKPTKGIGLCLFRSVIKFLVLYSSQRSVTDGRNLNRASTKTQNVRKYSSAIWDSHSFAISLLDWYKIVSCLFLVVKGAVIMHHQVRS